MSFKSGLFKKQSQMGKATKSKKTIKLINMSICPVQSMQTDYVVLMNPFHIDIKDEKEFEMAWTACAEFLKKQDGYIHTSLHKALNMEKSHFQYINYAHWESVEKFQKAIGEMKNDDCARKMALVPHQNSPSLYKVYIEM